MKYSKPRNYCINTLTVILSIEGIKTPTNTQQTHTKRNTTTNKYLMRKIHIHICAKKNINCLPVHKYIATQNAFIY